MGWLYMNRPVEGAKAYLDKQLTYEGETCSHRLLRSACYGRFEYYAAAEVIRKIDDPMHGIKAGDREVVCVVVIMRYTRDGQWGYKDMDETMDPTVDNCPESIMKLLTPTDHAYAIEWRARVMAKHAKRKASLQLGAGARVRYGGRTYELKEPAGPRRGWRVRCEGDGCLYRLKPGQLAVAEVLS